MKIFEKTLKKKLLLAAIASVGTLICLEVAFQIFISGFAGREHFSRYASLEHYRKRTGGDQWWFGLLTPHRYLGYTLVPGLVDGKNRHNSLGFRGEEIPIPKPKNEFRIVCIGASTTYSIMVPEYALSYPALLEKELRNKGFGNVRVVNAGVPAWTSYENLVSYLFRVQEIEPDLIIVKEAFGDVVCRLVWPPDAFKSDNSGCLAPNMAPRRIPFYEESALARVLLIESGHLLPASAMSQSVYNQAVSHHFIEFAEQRFGGTYPSGIFKSVPVSRMFEASTTRFFRRNIEDLVSLARANGVKTVIMTFPYSDSLTAYFGVPGFKEAVDQHNDIIRNVSAGKGHPLIDMAALFPRETEYWSPDGIHANHKGTALEAKTVARFLIENRILVESD